MKRKTMIETIAYTYMIFLIILIFLLISNFCSMYTSNKRKKLIKFMVEELKYQNKKVLEKNEIIERYEILSSDQRQIIDELWFEAVTEKERADLEEKCNDR